MYFVWISQLTAFISLHIGQDNSVGIVIHYMSWTVQGLNHGGGVRFSAPIWTTLGAHPASYTMGTRYFLGVNGWGVALTTHPHLAPRLKKE